MATLQLQFSEAYKRVSDFLGTGTSPTGTPLTKAKDIVYRAYRKFLFPFDTSTGQVYVWSFLRRSGTLILTPGKWKYRLPGDFSGLSYGFKYDNGENLSNPQKIDTAKLRAMRSISVATSASPAYYAINATQFDEEIKQGYEVWFQSPPSGTGTFKYEYIFEPQKPEDDTDLFVGGVRGSEVIMQLAVGIAESQENEGPGPQTQMGQELLTALMRYDQMYVPNNIELDPELADAVPNFRRQSFQPAEGGQ